MKTTQSLAERSANRPQNSRTLTDYVVYKDGKEVAFESSFEAARKVGIAVKTANRKALVSVWSWTMVDGNLEASSRLGEFVWSDRYSQVAYATEAR